MAQVTVSNVYNVDAEKLWGKVKAFNDLDKYLPSMITSCEVTGSGEGASRVCGTENGNIEETLQSIDENNMTLEYSVDNEDAPLPVANYRGKASIEKLAGDKARFTWSATFDAKGMPEADVIGLLEGAFGGITDNIAASV
ncbi:MAG: SRPBCC family protein [Gammaproteobacteria bacterium]